MFRDLGPLKMLHAVNEKHWKNVLLWHIFLTYYIILDNILKSEQFKFYSLGFGRNWENNMTQLLTAKKLEDMQSTLKFS